MGSSAEGATWDWETSWEDARHGSLAGRGEEEDEGAERSEGKQDTQGQARARQGESAAAQELRSGARPWQAQGAPAARGREMGSGDPDAMKKYRGHQGAERGRRVPSWGQRHARTDFRERNARRLELQRREVAALGKKKDCAR